MYSFFPQLYKRRLDIVSKQDTSADPWKAIQEALLLLDVKGMSSDETDKDASPKCVRRIRLSFLDRGFTTLFHTLESYAGDNVLKKDKRGNRQLERRHQNFTSNNARVVYGLPLNWYDPDWWRQLSVWEQAELEAGEKQPIPVLSPLS